MQITGRETRKCPPEYQARITRMFGVNRFGEPNFKIVWNQSNFIRLGKTWRDNKGRERVGYTDVYQGDGQPCWLIVRWMPPEHYGSPTTYYRETYSIDGSSRKYLVGEYPWKGRYEIVQPMIKKEFVNGNLHISTFPLCHYLIDMVIPMIIQWQELSIEEQMAAKQLAEQEKLKQENAEVAEKMMANMPTWIHPVSYSRQGCRTSLLDQKMFKIQKAWDRMSRRGRKPVFQKGFAQGDAPTRVN
jgi:hypothetical protein